MKDKIHKRFITALLCATMTVCLLPVVNAMETDSSQVQTNAGITEVVDLREETVKHFDMGDGTYRAVQYGRAVHRLDSGGKWQDIDNSLSLTSTKGVQTYTSQDQRTSFAPVYTVNQPIFTLSEDGTAVSLSLLTNTVNSGTVAMSASEEVLSPAVVTNSEQTQIATDAGDFDTAAAVNITSSVLYENVLPNTDLEYVLDGNDVKENIIVNAKADSYSYRFALDLDGLYPELLDSGSIILYDAVSDQEQYLIPAPFMYDANDILSEAVSYQLTQSDEKCYLTVTADADWINDDERIFPVVIDPTVQAVIDTNAFHDTFISSAYPSTTYGSYSKLWVTRDPSMYADSMIYLKPFLPELPDGSKVTDAEIALSYYYNDYCTSNFMQISAHYVTSSWTESGLTWNNASEWTNYGMSSAYIGIYYAFGAVGKYSSPGLIYIPLAVDKVNNWYNGVDDYGIGLKCHGGENYSVIISSYEEAKSTHRPCVTVTYEPPKMLEDGVYWIKNVSNSKYMTTANGGYSAGTVLQQSEKATGTDVIRNQLYKVEYLSSDSGKYTYSIRPLTNCAMGLSATSASGNATLQDYSTASSQRWYITDTGDYYSIQNKAIGSEGYLSSPSNSTNGSTLTFTSGSISRSNWLFEEYAGELENIEFECSAKAIAKGSFFDFDAIYYSTNIEVNNSITYSVTDEYGDYTNIATIDSSTGILEAKGLGRICVSASVFDANLEIFLTVDIVEYSYYFKNYYDSTMTQNRIDQVDNAIYFVDRAYSNQFGVAFSVIGDPCEKNDIFGGCTYGSNEPCSDNCVDYHHKDQVYISDQLLEEQSASNQRIVYWTDHEYGTFCNHYYGECEIDKVNLAVVIENRPVIHIMQLLSDNNSDALYEACMGLLLAHETAHTLGLEDVYNDEYDGIPHDGDGWNCVMERYNATAAQTISFYQEILNGKRQAFCDRCADTLKGKL